MTPNATAPIAAAPNNQSTYQQPQRRPWQGSYREQGGYREQGSYRGRDDRFEKMWGFVNKEMEEKERLAKERDRKQKEEEERKRQQEQDEKRQKEQQEKMKFQTNLRKLIKGSMTEVCESILGKKVAPTENVCAEMKIAMRISLVDKEIDSLKQENIALSKGIIELREEVNALRRGGEKRSVEVVTEKSPPVEPARVKLRVANRDLTPGDIAKMADAYSKLRDDKDYAEREVAALKEQINRLKIRTSPLVIRRRFALRNVQPTNLRKKMAQSVDEPEGEDAEAESSRPTVRFEKRADKTRPTFTKRFFLELSKLRKNEIDKLCLEEGISYNTIRGSAADLAERYGSATFPRLRRRVVIEEEKEDGEDDNQSVDIAEGEPGDRVDEISDC
ncbi:hypothetical protein CBR_g12356 [Chara braunii]|uniref:Uncharacterized protein n=1 Tax=Chara braunii TaxID=69332 RepID=A0A388KS13_CHABU|nr:hypothetical protein CBR_g12356 [Chara braunii]|eukprot:GBG72788.1 hypothetical protein CBR_g12356 [Chara braunii]